jgi:predicted short-subunit dehydrogenase-like oxidoreductase (DUF2520 family)
MLPGMSPSQLRSKPRIAIVGAGNLASVLAVSLGGAGYAVGPIISHKGSASLQRARRLAKEIGAVAATSKHGILNVNADVVWFCVPDAAIASAARDFLRATDWKPADWKAKIALHSSGALTSDELAVLRRQGAAVASVHPLMTFVRESHPSLAEVPFAIEGDARAQRVARAIVKNIGGRAYPIQKKNKTAYHTWGTFASPLLTALLVTSERVAASAGVKREDARQRMLPMLRQTLANYAASEGRGIFSGPIIRGDADTVKRHLQTLRRMPIAQEVYISLSRAALVYLPGKNKKILEKELRLSLRSRKRY